MTRKKLPAVAIVRWVWTISVLTALMVTILASPAQAQVMTKDLLSCHARAVIYR